MGAFFIGGFAARYWRLGSSGGASRDLSLRGCCFIVIVENNVQERAVDVQVVSDIVIYEAKLPESIHEEAHSRTSGSDHRGQGLLT